MVRFVVVLAAFSLYLHLLSPFLSFLFLFSTPPPPLLPSPIVENTRSGLPKHKYTCMQFYPVNKYLMCGAEDGSLRIYDPKTLVELACFMIHTKSVEQISWNGDQTMFVTGSKDNLCHLFDTAEIDRIVTALNGEHEVGEVEELKPMVSFHPSTHPSIHPFSQGRGWLQPRLRCDRTRPNQARFFPPLFAAHVHDGQTREWMLHLPAQAARSHGRRTGGHERRAHGGNSGKV